MELVQEVWSSLRPYLVHLISDAIISILLWVFLWIFKKLTFYFPIEGWAGEWITNIHSVGAVLAFSAFAILFVLDVVSHHSSNKG